MAIIYNPPPTIDEPIIAPLPHDPIDLNVLTVKKTLNPWYIVGGVAVVILIIWLINKYR